LTAAEVLSKADRAEEVLEWIARWVRDLVLIQIGADSGYLLSAGSPEHMHQVASGASLDALLSLLDAIEAFQRGATRNLNHQLAVENILLRLRDAFHPQPSQA
jgi:DNA polymerase-3 subunit delta'